MGGMISGSRRTPTEEIPVHSRDGQLNRPGFDGGFIFRCRSASRGSCRRYALGDSEREYGKSHYYFKFEARERGGSEELGRDQAVDYAARRQQPGHEKRPLLP